MSVDEDRRIVFEKRVRGQLWEFVDGGWSGERWLPAMFRRKSRRVIAVADSTLATTIPIPLNLTRDNAAGSTKITLAELENLIAQGMAKIFNGCRAEASKRLNVAVLDAVLVGAATEDFAIDGNPARTPIGLPGKKVSLLLTLTFTTRELFEILKPLFNDEGRRAFYFSEAPQASLKALSRFRRLPLNLITADRAASSLFVFMKAKEHPVLYRESLPWNFSALTEAIKKEFAVSDGVADQLYCLYHRDAMSDASRRAFKKILEPPLGALLAELDRAKVEGVLHIDAPHPLPFSLPHKHGATTIEEEPVRDILAGLGFTAPDLEGEDKKDAALHPLLYFLEAYFDKGDSTINRKLRRRLHWLART